MKFHKYVTTRGRSCKRIELMLAFVRGNALIILSKMKNWMKRIFDPRDCEGQAY